MLNTIEHDTTRPSASFAVAQAVAAFVQQQCRNGASVAQVARALKTDVATLKSIVVAVQVRNLIGGGA